MIPLCMFSIDQPALVQAIRIDSPLDRFSSSAAGELGMALETAVGRVFASPSPQPRVSADDDEQGWSRIPLRVVRVARVRARYIGRLPLPPLPDGDES